MIQGSGIGPASYNVAASDLEGPIYSENHSVKYADDTYLIIPANKSNSGTEELQNIKNLASANNLQLNQSKSKAIVFRAKRRGRQNLKLPLFCWDIQRTEMTVIIGVRVNDSLTVTDHIHETISACSRLLYALGILWNNGLVWQNLYMQIPSYSRLYQRMVSTIWLQKTVTYLSSAGRVRPRQNHMLTLVIRASRSSRFFTAGGMPHSSKVVDI